MSAEHYRALARKHWTKWLPEKVKELKAEGQLDAALRRAANLAQEEVVSLMQQGWPQFAAEEVALSQFILLKPEPEAELEPWERRELAQLEREYRQQMRREAQMEREWEEEDQREHQQDMLERNQGMLERK
ncbi:hypothetical protein D9M70_465720 [compost metagenome]